MGKKSRSAGGVALAEPSAPIPVVGAREPCPCGSGRRYKACHGRLPAGARRSSSCPVRSRACPARPTGSRCARSCRPPRPSSAPPRPMGPASVIASTVLPMAWPAMHRADGSVLLGLQTQGGSGDPSRDAAAALLTALEAEPGTPVAPGDLPGPGPRLQDVLDLDAPFEVAVHTGFDFWLAGRRGRVRRGPRVDGARQRRRRPHPAADLGRLGLLVRDRPPPPSALGAAEPEDRLLDAIARLHAADRSAVVEGSRYVGPSARTACSSPSGTSRPARTPRISRRRSRRGRICWPRPSPRPRP